MWDTRIVCPGSRPPPQSRDACRSLLYIIIIGDGGMSKHLENRTKEFEKEALEVHNEYRREHGAPLLVLNKNISKISQKWAEELAKKDYLSYSLNQNYGESVYCGWSSDPRIKVTARDCIDKWYSEINDYCFGNEPEVLKSGHFTQIVWKDSKELGVGSARSKSGKLYVVANYYPPGNYRGQFTKNVLPSGANQFSPTCGPLHIPLEAPVTGNRSIKAENYLEFHEKSDHSDKETSEIETKIKLTFISDSRFEEDFLDAHNEYRRKHRVSPLKLSQKLNQYASEWARILVKNGKMAYRDQDEYGENLYHAWSSDPDYEVSGRDPVDKWYSEVKDHIFGQESFNTATGHFTQVVWEDTQEVGVGVSRSKDGHVYVVANYYPPGNLVGSFARKVHPPF